MSALYGFWFRRRFGQRMRHCTLKNSILNCHISKFRDSAGKSFLFPSYAEWSRSSKDVAVSCDSPCQSLADSFTKHVINKQSRCRCHFSTPVEKHHGLIWPRFVSDLKISAAEDLSWLAGGVVLFFTHLFPPSCAQALWQTALRCHRGNRWQVTGLICICQPYRFIFLFPVQPESRCVENKNAFYLWQVGSNLFTTYLF